MELQDSIGLKRVYEKNMNTLVGAYEFSIKSLQDSYEKAQKCSHNIVVKFYASNKSYCDEKPVYICLGCEKDLTSKSEELENNSDVNIIDFTDEFWYFVSAKCGCNNESYLLIYALQDLATTMYSSYSDVDFTNAINKNTDVVMSLYNKLK